MDAQTVSLAGAAKWSLGKLPEGVEAIDLSQANAPEWVNANLRSGDGVMSDAALAFANNGVALRVAGPVSQTLPLTFSSAGHARIVVVLEAGASLTLLERHETGDGLRNIGMDVVLGEGARFTHARIAESAPDQVRIETVVGAPRERRALSRVISPILAASCRGWKWTSCWRARARRWR